MEVLQSIRYYPRWKLSESWSSHAPSKSSRANDKEITQQQASRRKKFKNSSFSKQGTTPLKFLIDPISSRVSASLARKWWKLSTSWSWKSVLDDTCSQDSPGCLNFSNRSIENNFHFHWAKNRTPHTPMLSLIMMIMPESFQRIFEIYQIILFYCSLQITHIDHVNERPALKKLSIRSSTEGRSMLWKYFNRFKYRLIVIIYHRKKSFRRCIGHHQTQVFESFMIDSRLKHFAILED